MVACLFLLNDLNPNYVVCIKAALVIVCYILFFILKNVLSIWPLNILYTADYFWNTLFGVKLDYSTLTSLFLSLWKDIVLYSNAFPPFLENNHMLRSLLNNVSNHSQDSNTRIYSFIQQIWIESTRGPGYWNHVQREYFPERRNRWDKER